MIPIQVAIVQDQIALLKIPNRSVSLELMDREKIDIAITYDAQALNEIAELRWKLAYTKYLQRTRTWFALGICLFLFGCYVLPHPFGFIIIGGSFTLILFSFDYFSYYRTRKTKYFNRVRDIYGEGTEARAHVSLRQSGIAVANRQTDAVYKWPAIREYFAKDGILFLRVNEDKSESVILREKELGSELFNQAVDFVKTKCPWLSK